MDRFSIPSMELAAGNEPLPEVFGPNGTRMIPRMNEIVNEIVKARAGSGVSLIPREDKRRRKKIAAIVASLVAGLGVLLAIYLVI